MRVYSFLCVCVCVCVSFFNAEILCTTVKPVLSGHSKREPKIGF